MADAASLLAAALSALVGMSWLALAMRPHWKQVRGEDDLAPAAARALRVGAAFCLLGALGLCLVADHVSMAALVWTMTTSAAALTVAMLLAYRPRWLGWLVAWVRVPSSGSSPD